MAHVILDHITKRFDNDAVALRDLSLQIDDGEFLILVGPSGCGKTTALRIVAGLEKPTSGTITIGDRVVNNVSPRDRDIAMVFQNYALYPHMTVYKNLAFGLKERKTPRAEIDRRVRAAGTMLGLDDLMKRRPAQLSGGSASVWRWAVRWSASRSPSCWTNRSRTWTRSSACRCARS